MWGHLVNLFWHSFHAMVSAQGSTTLGWLTPYILAALVFAIVAILQLRSKDKFLAHVRGKLTIALGGAFLANVLFYGSMWGWNFVRLIYIDHQTFVNSDAALQKKNRELAKELGWRKHNISTTDAVFPNIIYLLQAFQVYRGGVNGKRCVIWITAPRDSLPLASTVAQFSNSVSGCFTFGPGIGGPDQEEEAEEGMIPGVILLHSQRNDKAAFTLLSNLGNQIPCQLSYKALSNKFPHYQRQGMGERVIWLQFGPGVKWRSETYGRLN